MAKLFKRNTKIENASDRIMVLEVRQDPGNFIERRDVIQPAEHIYICYDDLNNEYNRGRPVSVYVFLEGRPREEKILLADVRVNEKIELNCLDGNEISITPTKGHFIQRLG